MSLLGHTQCRTRLPCRTDRTIFETETGLSDVGSRYSSLGGGGSFCRRACYAASGAVFWRLLRHHRFFGVAQGSTWAPTVAALGAVAWFVGHWSFAVRNDVHYRSRLARLVIDRTPLKWTIPRYWQLLQQERAANIR